MEDHCVSQGASPLKSRSTEGDSDTNTPILIDLTQDTDSPVLHTGTRSNPVSRTKRIKLRRYSPALHNRTRSNPVCWSKGSKRKVCRSKSKVSQAKPNVCRSKRNVPASSNSQKKSSTSPKDDISPTDTILTILSGRLSIMSTISGFPIGQGVYPV